MNERNLYLAIATNQRIFRFSVSKHHKLKEVKQSKADFRGTFEVFDSFILIG